MVCAHAHACALQSLVHCSLVRIKSTEEVCVELSEQPKVLYLFLRVMMI